LLTGGVLTLGVAVAINLTSHGTTGVEGNTTGQTALINPPSPTAAAPPRAPLDPTVAATPSGTTATATATSVEAGGLEGSQALAAQATAPEATATAVATATQAPPTPVPPTATAVPPTATPVPPSPTAIPPTATSIPPTPVPPTPIPPTPVPPTATTAVTQALPPATSLNNLESQMFFAHNQQRAANGVGALELDSTLVAVARQRAADMAQKGYFAHTSPSGETAFSILDGFGYRYAIAGENIARNNYPESQSVGVAMDGFMNSPGHRENILETQFTRVGIGMATDGHGMFYYAVVFAG
jgi:uncharacterized protein YkwD